MKRLLENSSVQSEKSYHMLLMLMPLVFEFNEL